MKYILSYIGLLVTALIYAAIVAAARDSVEYSVAGVPRSKNHEFAVIVDGTNYLLSPSTEDASLLFKGTAPIGKHYFAQVKKGTQIIIDKEPFERDAIPTKLNQIYGKSWTKKNFVRTFERVYEEVGGRQKTALHPADEIPILHIVADQAELDRLHEHYNQKIELRVDMTIIAATKVLKFNKVKFNIAGRGSRKEPKPSYTIQLAKGDKLGGYKSFKLRAAATDPTFLREKISFDMLVAAGLPASRTSYKRVYLNNVPVGLYLFAEKFDKSWFDQNLNPSLPDYKHDVLYEGKGSTKTPGELADLTYISSQPEVYGQHGYEIEMDNKAVKKGFTVLAEFIKFIDLQLQKPATNSTMYEQETVANWNKYLGVEIFLRNMVIEFLNTGWDNYLAKGNNYFLYKDPILEFLVYIGWDMELTFGNSPLPKSIQLEGDYRRVDGFQNRPLTRALFRVTYFRNYFEATLKTMLQKIYNPSVSFPVIDSLVDFLEEDVAWDRSVPRINADKDFSSPPVGGNIAFDVYPTFLPKGTDRLLLQEYEGIDYRKIEFKKSINGPTGYESLMGLKEFIQQKYDNAMQHTITVK